MKTPEAAAEQTFVPAAEDRGFPYILFLCVLGSFLAHATTFLLFQVVYPQRVTIPQPAPRVSLLTPSSPENIALLRWIEAEDPALVANDSPLAPPGLAEVHYRPSFAVPHTAPLGAPAEPLQGVRFPRAEDTLSTVDSTVPSVTMPASSVPFVTTITYSGGLAGRPLANQPPLAFEHHASSPVQYTTFLLGVTAEGKVQFVVLQHPSGDPHLDDLAQVHVRQVTFAPTDAPVAWGFATYSWGREAYVIPAAQAP